MYSGKSTFFFTSDDLERNGTFWQHVTTMRDKENEMQMIAGNHDTCKTVHMDVLASRLSAYLKKMRDSMRE